MRRQKLWPRQSRLQATLWIFVAYMACQASVAKLCANEQIWRIPLGDRTTIDALIGRPDTNTPARAAIILVPGGDGRLQLHLTGTPSRLQGDFLVRTRRKLRQHGYITALLDAPSDRQNKPGLLAGYRATQRHAVRNIGAVIDRLVASFKVPVIVIGTSRGTVSAVNAARRLHSKIAGVGLTASITQPNRRGATIHAIKLATITVPTLFVHHVDDRCAVTPLHGARAAFEAMQAADRHVRWGMVSGGLDGARPCSGKSFHGFWQSEGQAIGHIRTWLGKVLAK